MPVPARPADHRVRQPNATAPASPPGPNGAQRNSIGNGPSSPNGAGYPLRVRPQLLEGLRRSANTPPATPLARRAAAATVDVAPRRGNPVSAWGAALPASCVTLFPELGDLLDATRDKQRPNLGVDRRGGLQRAARPNPLRQWLTPQASRSQITLERNRAGNALLATLRNRLDLARNPDADAAVRAVLQAQYRPGAALSAAAARRVIAYATVRAGVEALPVRTGLTRNLTPDVAQRLCEITPDSALLLEVLSTAWTGQDTRLARLKTLEGLTAAGGGGLTPDALIAWHATLREKAGRAPLGLDVSLVPSPIAERAAAEHDSVAADAPVPLSASEQQRQQTYRAQTDYRTTVAAALRTLPVLADPLAQHHLDALAACLLRPEPGYRHYLTELPLYVDWTRRLGQVAHAVVANFDPNTRLDQPRDAIRLIEAAEHDRAARTPGALQARVNSQPPGPPVHESGPLPEPPMN